jgi:hypothetical protein
MTTRTRLIYKQPKLCLSTGGPAVLFIPSHSIAYGLRADTSDVTRKDLDMTRGSASNPGLGELVQLSIGRTRAAMEDETALLIYETYLRYLD